MTELYFAKVCWKKNMNFKISINYYIKIYIPRVIIAEFTPGLGSVSDRHLINSNTKMIQYKVCEFTFNSHRNRAWLINRLQLLSRTIDM